jgi:ribosomal protein RSM22 (predicted rRNA methylase)
VLGFYIRVHSREFAAKWPLVFSVPPCLRGRFLVMRLPPALSHAIQQEIENTDRAELAQAVAQLTQRYKAGRFSSPAVTTQTHCAAYLAVRVPATFAANLRVLSEIRRLAPEAEITSILDLGAGPGTALFAATELFPLLTQATMVEADKSFTKFGRQLSRESSNPAIRSSKWLQQNLNMGGSFEPHDLVVISYTLNELSPAAAEKTVSQAWQCAREFLVLVEPGTMRGFGFIHAARSQLIAAGASILAPCPHAAACPMAAAGDWCHFAQRVERTSIHRRLKGGVLGFEDEKFSYLVAGHSSFSRPEARIVRHPQKRSGHVQFLLCTPHGLESTTIGKSQKENYKLARKAEWGDAWG